MPNIKNSVKENQQVNEKILEILSNLRAATSKVQILRLIGAAKAELSQVRSIDGDLRVQINDAIANLKSLQADLELQKALDSFRKTVSEAKNSQFRATATTLKSNLDALKRKMKSTGYQSGQLELIKRGARKPELPKPGRRGQQIFRRRR